MARRLCQIRPTNAGDAEGGTHWAYMYGAARVVEEPTQNVVVGMTHAYVGVCHVTGFYALSRRAWRRRQVGVDHPLPDLAWMSSTPEYPVI